MQRDESLLPVERSDERSCEYTHSEGEVFHMNIHRYLAALLIAPALTLTQPSLAQRSKPNPNQKLAMYAQPAVVRILNLCFGEYKDNEIEQEFHLSFLGTGFLINPNGYIVTSANVIGKKECKNRLADNISRTIKEKYREEKKPGEIKTSLDEGESGSYYSHDQLVMLPNANVDLLPFKIKESGRDEGEFSKIDNDVAIIKIPVTNAPTLELGDSNQVEIQDRILTVGYPTTADIKLGQDLTEESYYEASVQEGSISSTTKQLEGGYPVLQIDIQTGKGSGGSPLLNDQGKVIGMLVSRQSWSTKDNTIPFAIPTSTIRDFIAASGTINDHKGATDQLYDEGLDLFLKGNYKDAKTKFLKVKGLFKVRGVSSHAEVERLIDEIDQIEADWWAKPWTNPTYLLMMGLFTGGGVVAAVAYFLLRHQSSARKASPVSAGASAEDRSTSTNSYKNGVGSSQSWLELEYKGQIRRFQLDRDEHRLGRDPAWSDFDIPTSWEVVSRHHAILRKEGEDYRIYDGDGKVPSRNGLWIDDDARVDYKDGYPLENGDRLKIGQDAHEQIILTYYNPNNYQANLKTTRMAD